LIFRHAPGADMAGDDLHERGGQRNGQADPQRSAGEIQMPPFEQVPRADAHDQEGARLPRTTHHVGEPLHRGRIEHQLPEIRDFRALDAVVHDNFVARGRLHPGIGDHNPHRAEMRAQADHARGKEMHLAAHPVPTKHQDGQKTGFEEKGEDAFRCQCAAENIADKARIGCPIRAELEFHHDTGRHADGKGERKHPRPKSRHLVIDGVFGFEPQPFHANQEQAKADAQRRIKIMKRDRGPELDARQS